MPIKTGDTVKFHFTAKLENGKTVESTRRKKPVKNAAKPRFFERSRPNQLWQSDIMTFRLGGKNAYLIGYLDDYSRYITGLVSRMGGAEQTGEDQEEFQIPLFEGAPDLSQLLALLANWGQCPE